MTFLNSDNSYKPNTTNFSYSETKKSNNKEVDNFKKIITIIVLLISLIVVYFLFNLFYKNTNSVKIAQIEEVADFDTDLKLEHSKTTSFNDENNNLFVSSNDLEIKKKEKNKMLVSEDIFQINSSNPSGYYVMVGSFKDYENALRLQNMNPTGYTCHIFEPNHKKLNRVGLFISKTDERKAKNALKEIKNMQKQSWILYNTEN